MVSLGDFGNEEKQGRQEEILPLTGRRWHDRPVPASSEPSEPGGDEFLDVPGTEPGTAAFSGRSSLGSCRMQRGQKLAQIRTLQRDLSRWIPSVCTARDVSSVHH